MSFASHHTGSNIGCCIVRAENPKDANEESKRLGLMPNECNHAKGYVIPDETFPEQGMELNKFYTRQQMIEMGFEIG